MNLPLSHRTHDVACSPPARDAQDSRPSAIVLVDDESAVLSVLQRLVRGLTEEHALTAVNGSLAALELIDLLQVRLLITDYNMVGMNGLQLIDAVKKVSPRTHTVLITAYDSPDLRRRVRASQADDYLAKPFALEHLEQIVRTVLAMA